MIQASGVICNKARLGHLYLFGSGSSTVGSAGMYWTPSYRSTLRMKLRGYAYIVGLLLLSALWILPLAYKGLRYEPFLRAFLVGNFPIVVPVMLAACVLLWIRHQRAFRYVEIVSPLCISLRR